MSDDAPAEIVSPPRRLKALRIDLVKATPGQIAEQLIRVGPAKAAHVALILAASVTPSLLTATRERLGRAVERVQERPVETAGRLLAALVQDPDL